MKTERSFIVSVIIITLLVANLGVSTYIALRPSPVRNAEVAKDVTTSDVKESEARELAEAVVPLYNKKDNTALYNLFDPLAKAQFTKAQLSDQVDKLSVFIGRIDTYAYSHATLAGTQNGRTYYTLNYKISVSGGALSTGDMTLTVARTKEGLALYGFFAKGSSMNAQ